MFIRRIVDATGPTLKVEIVAVYGEAASLPLKWEYTQDGVRDIIDLTGIGFELRIFTQAGAAAYTFTSADCPVNTGTGEVEPQWTALQAASLAVGLYTFRFVSIQGATEHIIIAGLWRQITGD